MYYLLCVSVGVCGWLRYWLTSTCWPLKSPLVTFALMTQRWDTLERAAPASYSRCSFEFIWSNHAPGLHEWEGDFLIFCCTIWHYINSTDYLISQAAGCWTLSELQHALVFSNGFQMRPKMYSNSSGPTVLKIWTHISLNFIFKPQNNISNRLLAGRIWITETLEMLLLSLGQGIFAFGIFPLLWKGHQYYCLFLR